QIVPLEVGEDVFHEKWISSRLFQWWISTAVVEAINEGTRGSEQIIEVSVLRVVHGFDIRNAAVTVNHQIRHVTGMDAYLIEDGSSARGCHSLLSEARLEVIQEIELQVVHDRRINFILTSFGIWTGRRADCVQIAIKHHACRSYDPSPCARLGKI